MRKIFLFVLTSIFFVMCSKKGEDIPSIPEPSFSIDTKNVSIMYGEDCSIGVDVKNFDIDDLSIKVRDEFVAEAKLHSDNKIRISSNHVGETFLVLSYKGIKDSCSIKVTPTDFIIEEPAILDFEADKAIVKNKEKRELIKENDNSLEYKIDTYNSITYYFKDNKLDKVYRWAGSFSYIQSGNILREMYEFVKSENGAVYRKKNLWVKLTRSQGGASRIYYSNDSKKLSSYTNLWN